MMLNHSSVSRINVFVNWITQVCAAQFLANRILIVSLIIMTLCLLSSAPSLANGVVNPPEIAGPNNELHLARLVYRPNSQNGWHPPGRPWWRIDWPEADAHLIDGIRRYTRVQPAADSAHVSLSDDAIFDYPLLLAQQVGRWYLDDDEIARLGTYLRRGGFLIVDDFHGPEDWRTFYYFINKALSSYQIKEIRPEDTLMTIHFPIEQFTQIPGRRHIVGLNNDGTASVRMPDAPQRWLGIFDDDDRMMAAVNFNMDMGDAWEHANDPDYPNAMTALAYRFGINYILYALTH